MLPRRERTVMLTGMPQVTQGLHLAGEPGGPFVDTVGRVSSVLHRPRSTRS
jgi:hypothetical protein